MFCDEHYSYECGCEPAAPPAPAPLPAAVWVVVEVYSKSVQVAKAAAVDPIQGRMAIFQKPEVTQQIAARIVGVYEHEADAHRMVENKEGAEYLVERHEFRSTSLPVAVVVALQESRCILCDTPSPTTFCKACEARRNEKLRQLNGDAISEQMPLVPNTFHMKDPVFSE